MPRKDRNCKCPDPACPNCQGACTALGRHGSGENFRCDGCTNARGRALTPAERSRQSAEAKRQADLAAAAAVARGADPDEVVRPPPVKKRKGAGPPVASRRIEEFMQRGGAAPEIPVGVFSLEAAAAANARCARRARVDLGGAEHFRLDTFGTALEGECGISAVRGWPAPAGVVGVREHQLYVPNARAAYLSVLQACRVDALATPAGGDGGRSGAAWAKLEAMLGFLWGARADAKALPTDKRTAGKVFGGVPGLDAMAKREADAARAIEDAIGDVATKPIWNSAAFAGECVDAYADGAGPGGERAARAAAPGFLAGAADRRDVLMELGSVALGELGEAYGAGPGWTAALAAVQSAQEQLAELRREWVRSTAVWEAYAAAVSHGTFFLTVMEVVAYGLAIGVDVAVWSHIGGQFRCIGGDETGAVVVVLAAAHYERAFSRADVEAFAPHLLAAGGGPDENDDWDPRSNRWQQDAASASGPELKLVEFVDVGRLRRHIATGRDRRPHQAKALLKLAEAGGGLVEVTYRKARHGRGRWYAVTPSLQTVRKDARAAACGGHCVDVDMVNAYPRLLDHMTAEQLPSLHAYVTDREAWLRHVSQHYRLPEADGRNLAKLLFLRLLFGGTARGWKADAGLPDWTVEPLFVEHFRRDCLRARDALLKARPDVLDEVRRLYPDRRAPQWTALSVIVSEVEDQALQVVTAAAQAAGFTVRTLCFDGFIMDAPVLGDLLLDFLRQVEQTLAAAGDPWAPFEVKPFAQFVEDASEPGGMLPTVVRSAPEDVGARGMLRTVVSSQLSAVLHDAAVALSPKLLSDADKLAFWAEVGTACSSVAARSDLEKLSAFHVLERLGTADSALLLGRADAHALARKYGGAWVLLERSVADLDRVLPAMATWSWQPGPVLCGAMDSVRKLRLGLSRRFPKVDDVKAMARYAHLKDGRILHTRTLDVWRWSDVGTGGMDDDSGEASDGGFDQGAPGGDHDGDDPEVTGAQRSVVATILAQGKAAAAVRLLCACLTVVAEEDDAGSDPEHDGSDPDHDEDSSGETGAARLRAYEHCGNLLEGYATGETVDSIPADWGVFAVRTAEEFSPQLLRQHLRGYLLLKGAWGSRKSEAVADLLEQHARGEAVPGWRRVGFRLVLVTYRRSLVRSLAGALAQRGLPVVRYMDVIGPLCDDLLVVQFDSLPRIPPLESVADGPDLLWVDELCSVLLHMESDTMSATTKVEALSKLHALAQTARTVIGADKNVGARELHWVRDLALGTAACPDCGRAATAVRCLTCESGGAVVPSWQAAVTVLETTWAHEEMRARQVHLTFDREGWRRQLEQDIEGGRRVAVASMSAEFATDLARSLRAKYPFLRRRGALLLHVGTGVTPVDNVNAMWASARVVIYSPVVEAGVSYTNAAAPFARIYGFVGQHSVTAASFAQMLHRIRHARSRIVAVLVSGLVRAEVVREEVAIESIHANMANPHWCARNRVSVAADVGVVWRVAATGAIEYPLRDAFFHVHVFNAWEMAMSATYFLACLVRQLKGAGYARFRFGGAGTECPDDGDEDPALASLYNGFDDLDDDDRDFEEAEDGEGDGIGEGFEGDDNDILTDELIAAAPWWWDEAQCHAMALRGHLALPDAAGLARSRLEHQYGWREQLDAQTVRRYRDPAVIGAHCSLSAAFGAARSGDAVLAVAAALARLRRLEEADHDIRARLTTSGADVFRPGVARLLLGVQSLSFFGITDLSRLATDGVPLGEFYARAPAYVAWLCERVGYQSRLGIITNGTATSLAETPKEVARCFSTALAPFGLKVAVTRAHLAVRGLKLWELTKTERGGLLPLLRPQH